jgi:glycosyltransferase involved in cell wall biosynthesis
MNHLFGFMNTSSRIPIVSVVIPTYGHAEFILKTLESVFSQTFQQFEVIVINDGSPDLTEEVLKSLIETEKIRYVFQENQGVANARNHGISLAKGKYVAFLDDDDLWPPDKLEWQLKVIENGSAIAVGGSVGKIGRQGELIPSTESLVPNRFITFEEFFDGNPFVSPGQVLIDAAVFRKVGGFDPEIWGSDDYEFFYRLWQAGPILRSTKTCLFYRIHEANASNNHHKMMLNTKKVMIRLLQGVEGKDRSKLKTRGHLWMFDYLGGSLINKSINSLKESPVDLKNLKLSLSVFIKVFGSQMLIDPILCKRVVGHIYRYFSRRENISLREQY